MSEPIGPRLTSRSMLRHLAPSGLFTRVILHGLLLVITSAIGFFAIALIVVGPTKERQMRVLTHWCGQLVCDRYAASPEPTSSLVSFPLAAGLFDQGGRVLATSPVSPFNDLEPSELDRLHEKGEIFRGFARLVSVPCDDDATRFAVVGGPLSPVYTTDVLLLLGGLVLVITLASLPLARSLVRPLVDLARTADTLGRGHLSARADVDRRDEIGDLARAFNRMAENLSSHLLAEKELLANVSHELRTPLARVRVVMEIAKESPERAGALLEEVAKDLSDLERLTDDVLAAIRLDFSGAENEAIRIRCRPEQVDLLALCRLRIARYAELFPDREIELEAPDEVPPLQGDPALLVRLIDNLLENARRYSSEAVLVRLMTSSDGLTLEVEDHGIGIEANDLERVFEPFFRSERSRGRASGGTGLGLTLCRRIADVHQGRIMVESEPSVGTTVRVFLPLDPKMG